MKLATSARTGHSDDKNAVASIGQNKELLHISVGPQRGVPPTGPEGVGV